MCNQGRSQSEEGTKGGNRIRVAPGIGGISVGLGRSWAMRMTWQTLQGWVWKWPKLQRRQEQPAGTTADTAGRVHVSYKLKGYQDQRCVDTHPGQCCESATLLGQY
jgi:hypothetical protein